jgi:hypothetical protein
MTGPAALPLLGIRRIYLEPAAAALPRGAEILARFPDAERIEVASHWRIPELREAEPGDYLGPKRETLVFGVKKGLEFRPNGRSADFIAPSSSNGCAMACAYCYVARRKGHANPITVFASIEEITAATARHAASLGPKTRPNQVDERDWVYDLGENGDLSVDALVSDNVRDLVARFRNLPNAKGSFATKWVNPDLLGYDPQGRTRIRMSLMPHGMARTLDVRTAPVAARIAALPDLHRAGYEVELNFSPVVLREGWEAEWGAIRGAGRHAARRAEGAPRRRGHPADPQRRATRGEPGLAPEGGGAALASRHPGGEAERVGRGEPALPHGLEGPLAEASARPARRPHALSPGALRVLRP